MIIDTRNNFGYELCPECLKEIANGCGDPECCGENDCTCSLNFRNSFEFVYECLRREE